MRIETLERRGRRLFVNGKSVKTWNVSTWSVVDNDEELAAWQGFLELIGATGERLWLGWNKRWNPGLHHHGRAEFRRGAAHLKWCLEHGIVPQVSLLQATEIEEAKLRPEHKAHIDAILEEIADIPNVILEVANEASQAALSTDGVRYLRSLGLDNLIAVTTGRNGPVQKLEDVGADIVAVTPSYVPRKRLVLQADSDHGSKQALNQSKIPFFETWLAQGAQSFVIMAAWDDPDLPGIESHIPGYNKPWNNPNNPHILAAIEWCQENIGDQISDQEPPSPPPEPPGPPPSPPPEPPPPPGEEEEGKLDEILDRIEAFLEEVWEEYGDEILASPLGDKLIERIERLLERIPDGIVRSMALAYFRDWVREQKEKAA